MATLAVTAHAFVQRIGALVPALGWHEGTHARVVKRGEARGKRETMLATAKRMLESGMLALKDIAKFSGLSLAQVKKLQAEMA